MRPARQLGPDDPERRPDGDGAAALRSAQEIYDAALRSATETFEHARSTVDASQGDGVKIWLQALQSMMHTGVRPMDDLFGQPLLRGLMVPGLNVGAAFPD